MLKEKIVSAKDGKQEKVKYQYESSNGENGEIDALELIEKMNKNIIPVFNSEVANLMDNYSLEGLISKNNSQKRDNIKFSDIEGIKRYARFY